MSTELVSANVFHWILIALTGGLAGLWFILDAIKLYRVRNAGDALARDQRFGYAMGVLIGAVGVVGCFIYHLDFVS